MVWHVNVNKLLILAVFTEGFTVTNTKFCLACVNARKFHYGQRESLYEALSAICFMVRYKQPHHGK
jgi:hypothetical protein